jgi:hypothetical protein
LSEKNSLNELTVDVNLIGSINCVMISLLYIINVLF